MIHELVRDLCLLIIERGELSQAEVGDAVGRTRQIVTRWKNTDQLPKPAQLEALIEKAHCSPLTVAELACEKLSEQIGRRVMVAPEEEVRYLPTQPLARAVKLYQKNQHKLSAEQRDLIEDKLRQGRTVDASVEHLLSSIERDVKREIANAEQLAKQHASG